MKKVFFAFVAVSVMALASCNNKPAENTEATAADTTAVTEAAEAAAPAADSTAAPADTTVAAQ